MRIISGSAGGLRLKVPKRVTRPSTDRLREALFSILAARVGEARVLDLFAGSGALGIEALSRGAGAATFVEADGGACAVISANLKSSGLQGQVARGDVFSVLKRLAGPFDLVLADPPYALPGREDLAEKLLECETLRRLLDREGLLVLEVEAGREAPEAAEWVLDDRRTYGSSAILFYELRGAP